MRIENHENKKTINAEKLFTLDYITKSALENFRVWMMKEVLSETGRFQWADKSSIHIKIIKYSYVVLIIILQSFNF